ncbi:MAG: DUF2892 domain-containing protein [Asticcacaulis sp.]|nr:DUF2892 domain-containing protein [Asticcacaulis sp.]
MPYVKNLPAWERLLRFAAVALMAACAWHYKLSPVGIVFGAAAAFTAVTAVFGWCPACAMAGRRLKSGNGN